MRFWNDSFLGIECGLSLVAGASLGFWLMGVALDWGVVSGLLLVLGLVSVGVLLPVRLQVVQLLEHPGFSLLRGSRHLPVLRKILRQTSRSSLGMALLSLCGLWWDRFHHTGGQFWPSVLLCALLGLMMARWCRTLWLADSLMAIVNASQDRNGTGLAAADSTAGQP